jgi:hypothetical protein
MTTKTNTRTNGGTMTAEELGRLYKNARVMLEQGYWSDEFVLNAIRVAGRHCLSDAQVHDVFSTMEQAFRNTNPGKAPWEVN